MNKYGALLDGIDIERIGKTRALTAIIVRALNRLVFVLCVMFFLERPYFTIMFMTQNIVFYTIYITWAQPYNSKALNRRMILFEVINLYVVYHLYCFTEWTDFHQKIVVGNSIILFILAQTLVFLLIFVSGLMRKVSVRFHPRW